MTAVRLRPATPEDALALWQWRNDPEVRRASFAQEPVPLEEHRRWLAETLGRADRRLFVALLDGEAVATARLDLTAEEAVVSLTVAPERRGLGLGPAVLDALAAEAFGRLGLRKLVARVKGDNLPSRRAFERAGFRGVGTAPAAAVLTLVRERGA